jgi:DNA-binding XRE family transcriptional regulator
MARAYRVISVLNRISGFLLTLLVSYQKREGVEANVPQPPMGQLLRSLRTERGLTQKQVAKMLGLSNQTICAVERWPVERRLPPSARRYAAALGFELIESCTYSLSPMHPPRRQKAKAA